MTTKPPRLASSVRYMPSGRLAVFNSVCIDGRWLLRMRDTGRYVVTVPERCVVLIEKKARTMKALREYAEQLKDGLEYEIWEAVDRMPFGEDSRLKRIAEISSQLGEWGVFDSLELRYLTIGLDEWRARVAKRNETRTNS